MLPFPRRIPRRWLKELLVADPGDSLDEDMFRVSGALPAELRGTLYVNGPSRLVVGDSAPSHPLDGHGYVRSYRIDGAGRVHLKGRFVRTWAFNVEMFFGFALFRGFFSLPLRPLEGLFGWVFNSLAMWRKNVANTHVVEWAGRLLALWEMGPPHALDRHTLATSGTWEHLSYLKGESRDCAVSRLRPLLAHTKRWAAGARSRLVALSAIGARYSFYEFDLDGACAATTEADMPFDASSLVHDFAITRDYYVVHENPMRYADNLNAGSWSTLRALFGAEPAIGYGAVASATASNSRLVLVPRPKFGEANATGDPIVLDTGAHSVAFHHANAYERDGELSLLSCGFEEYRLGSEYGFDSVSGVFDPSYLLRHEASWGPFLYETTIDLAGAEAAAAAAKATGGSDAALAGFVTRRLADGQRVHRDFPRVHPDREGRPVAFVYVAAAPDLEAGDSFFPFSSVQKVAPGRGTPPLTWTPARPGCYVGEPVFAPSLQPGAAEDDGWVLVLVHDVPGSKSELVVLDARDMAPVAEFRVDTLLPLGLHGSWSADA